MTQELAQIYDKLSTIDTKVHNRINGIDNRITVAENEIANLNKHLIKQEITLENMGQDLHKISLNIASGKGWIVGILGAGAFIYTALDWSMKIFFNK